MWEVDGLNQLSVSVSNANDNKPLRYITNFTTFVTIDRVQNILAFILVKHMTECTGLIKLMFYENT